MTPPTHVLNPLGGEWRLVCATNHLARALSLNLAGHLAISWQAAVDAYTARSGSHLGRLVTCDLCCEKVRAALTFPLDTTTTSVKKDTTEGTNDSNETHP